MKSVRSILGLAIIIACIPVKAQQVKEDPLQWRVSAYYGLGWIRNDLGTSKATGQQEVRVTADMNHLWNLSFSAGTGTYNSSSSAIYETGPQGEQKMRFSNVNSSLATKNLSVLAGFNVTPLCFSKSGGRLDFLIGYGFSFAKANNSFTDLKDVSTAAPYSTASNSSISGIYKSKAGNYGYFPVGLNLRLPIYKRLTFNVEGEYRFYNSDMPDGIWSFSNAKGRWFDHTMNLKAGLGFKF